MAKSDYVNPRDEAFVTQLKTYQNGIGNYKTELNKSATDITTHTNDTAYMEWCVDCNAMAQKHAQQWTTYKNSIRNGGNLPDGGGPVAPTYPDAPTAVAPGIEPRFRAGVQQDRKSTGYTDSIGQALGTIGAEQTPPDLATLQPDIEAEINGNQIAITWGWGGYSDFLDMIEIQVDRGDGKGFVLLTYDTTPNYTDTFPFPATPTKWTYKAIYRVGDAQVGLWSKPVTITVGS